VHGLRGDVQEIARLLHDEAVDIVLLQESGPRRRLRALGETLGMTVCADPRAFPRRRIQNAVLVRGGAVGIVHARLRRFSGGSLVHPRGALVVDVDQRFSVLSVHLGLRGPERGRHIRQLLESIEGSTGPLVLGGDLNTSPDDPGPRAIAGRLKDVWRAVGEGSGATFPSHEPTARIDYLFAGQAVRPLRAWTAGGALSDHLMVVADLELEVNAVGAAPSQGSGRAGSP
jgi:endonuclease/exonuclease/phosphatase family metal-dependent hydrolase